MELNYYSAHESNSWYEFNSPHVRVAVWTHDLVNDKNMMFEDYPYQISVWGVDDKNPEARERWGKEFANSIYQKLKAQGKHRLMMTDDIQRKLAEYDPRLGGGSLSTV